MAGFEYTYRPTGKVTASESNYPNLPIYELWVQTVPTVNGRKPTFNTTNYDKMGDDNGTFLWWRPADQFNQGGIKNADGTIPACRDYIRYTPGDEFTYVFGSSNCINYKNDKNSSSIAIKPPKNAVKGQIVSNLGGTKKYVATGQTFSWNMYKTKVDTKITRDAPFKNDEVMIWVEFFGTNNQSSYEPNVFLTNITPYYFDDQVNFFVSFAQYDKLKKLMSSSVDPDNASSNPAGVSNSNGAGSRSSGKSKFQNYNGNKDELDLNSLVLAQIAELESRGSSPSSALATVIDINERAQYNLRFNEFATTFDSSEFIQDPNRAEGAPPLAGNALPVVKPGEFTPSDISIQVRFSNSGVGYGGIMTIPDVPVMIQTYPYYDANTDSMSFVADKFFFHYKPNNITYANIGAEWQDIPRVNNTPLVDFKNFKLMKITFEFIVAEKIDEVSSLYASCEAQLKMLRQMATRPEYVQFTNMDTLFSEQLIYPDFFSSGVATYFSIVDMSITSVQRSRQSIDTPFGAPAGSINRATVNMTVQEVNSSGPPPIFLPRITQPPVTPPPPDIPGKDQICKSRFTWISPARWQQKPQPQSCTD